MRVASSWSKRPVGWSRKRTRRGDQRWEKKLIVKILVYARQK